MFTFSQSYSQDKKTTLLPSDQKEIIEKLNKILSERYVFEETAAKIVGTLKTNLEAGKYQTQNEAQSFAGAINKDMSEIANDKHLMLEYNPGFASELQDKIDNPEKYDKQRSAQLQKNNYGFREMKLTPENIGYLRFNSFPDLKYSQGSIEASMEFLKNADVLIIDLTSNGGGRPETVQLMCSYFFDSKPRLLNSLKSKTEKKDYYTLRDINGKRMIKQPVFILVGSNTFSAAEEFAYNMQTQKRAILIGETTGGGANDNVFLPLPKGFVVSVSISQAINPITNTNWEGVGVKPDIEVSQSKAYTTALIEAGKKLLETNKNPEEISYLKWKIESLQAELNPIDASGLDYSEFAGNYDPRKVFYENCSLYYQRAGNPTKRKLTWFGNDTFLVEGIDNFRVKFERNSENKILALIGMYSDGRTDKNEKVN
jgi:hypothetical protein